jgi:signal transduction histidine kinase
MVGWLGVSLLVAAVILGTLYLMRYLHTEIAVLEEMTKLEEIVLEMRRAEKNLFLYADRASGQKAFFLTTDAERILLRNAASVDALSSPSRRKAFQGNLLKYRTLISSFLGIPSGNGVVNSEHSTGESQAGIRAAGSELAAFAQTIADRSRKDIEKTTGLVERIQFAQLLFLALMVAGFWTIISGKIIRPLRLLERQTEMISQGDYREMPSPPVEKEIRQVFESFNRMASELKRRQRQLVRAERLASLGTLTAGVAHEVSNPLSNIRSSCEILLEDMDELDKEFLGQSLGNMITEVDRAQVIVKDLLVLSRDKRYVMETLNLRHLVSRSVDFLRYRIPLEVDVRTNIADDIVVRGDDARMLTVFMNLIANAVEAIEGYGTVLIEAGKAEDGMVNVAVTDNGKGISAADIERIFDPFFTTKDVGKGTGLGLFLAHEIVMAHGGEIWAESVAGEGTTIALRLPAQEG